MKSNTDIKFLKGVGDKRAQKLRKLNINTVEDLLFHIPRDYEDRMHLSSVGNCQNGEIGVFNLKVESIAPVKRISRNLLVLNINATDGDFNVQISFFNQPYLVENLRVNEYYFFYGRIEKKGYFINLNSPEIMKKLDESLLPVYSLTEGINRKLMIKLISTALEENYSFSYGNIPSYVIDKYNLPEFKEALYNIHFPKSIDIVYRARKALAFYELFALQLTLEHKKRSCAFIENAVVMENKHEINNWISSLNYRLTDAQQSSLISIIDDLTSGKRMNRLIQGDVGSGKTVIALAAMLLTALNGYQSVLMVPTEILATQHYETALQLFEKYDVGIELLVGSLSAKKKNEAYSKIKDGTFKIIIGTHAIIQDKVEFKNLALVITDEQHRFGVDQRNYLFKKNPNAHNLVMSATPIPRTLSMIIYGDLDISIIDELPPGRSPIKTFVINENMVRKMYDFISEQLKDGRQVYVICPLIEENEKLDLQAAFTLYRELSVEVFPEWQLALLHGKLSASEKEEIMRKFSDGEIDILVSTTVVEVGVNVPNANIMAVYNSERFGLASLHQLRGRVGRGKYQSYCFLINTSKSREAWQRMKILEKSNDGFAISQADLELRGPGDYFGIRQSGIPNFKFTDLSLDYNILNIAKNEAAKILYEDPKLNSDKNVKLIFLIENMYLKFKI